MKIRCWAVGLMVLGGVVVGGCTSSSHPAMTADTQAPQLFELNKKSDLQVLEQAPGIYPYLNTLINDPASEQVQVVTVNASLVTADTQTLSVPLNSDETVAFKLKRADPPAPGMEGWVGDALRNPDQKPRSVSEVDFDPFTWISLVRKGDQLVGSMYVDGQHYRLEYIGAGQHVLIKEDASKLPAETAATSDPDVRSLKAAAGQVPHSAHSTIRVLFSSTNEVRERRPTYRQQLLLALQTANQYMINSQVPVTFEVAGFNDVDYCECGKTGVEQFQDFRTAGRELNTQVLQRRAELYADLVTLYTSWPGTGGEASGAVYTIVGNYPSLGHEYGHNLGATHRWNGNPNAGYNHGYEHADPKFHTIMVTTAYAIPYFSNPNLFYQGVRIGTFEHHDVARRFNERREEIENFYPPMPAVQVTVFDDINMQGDRCTFDLAEDARTTLIEDACGAAWKTKVWSVRVKNFGLGHTLRIGNTSAWHTYTSQTYGGSFDIPTLTGFAHDVPVGLVSTPHGGNLSKKITQVEFIKATASGTDQYR